MLYYISSFNSVTIIDGKQFYQNTITKLYVSYSKNIESKIDKILNQQLSKIEISYSGIIFQLLTAELLYMGIIVPIEYKDKEEEYLNSIVLFKLTDNAFFKSKLLTEYELLEQQFNIKDIIFCGIPSDIGSSKPGTRFGPYFLRKNSAKIVYRADGSCCLNLQKLDNVFDNKKIFDIGDINLPLEQKNESLKKVEYVSQMVSKRCIPFFIGGDHLFTLPIVKGIYNNRKNKDFTIIQLDNHLDVQIWGDFYCGKPKKLSIPNHGNFISWIKHYMPETNILQVGINNYQSVAEYNLNNVIHYLNYIGQRITNTEIFNNNQEYLENKLPKNQDIYLTIDVDIINAIYMPSTGYPAETGINLETLFFIIKQICSYNNIIGIDIMEFSQNSHHEFYVRTSNIVNTLILEIIKEI